MFLRKFKKKEKDSGAAELISALLIIPILFILIVSVIDGAVYFNNKTQVQTWANNGARTTSIYGGAGSTTKETVIEAAYGTACNWDPSVYNHEYMQANPTNAVECNVLKEIGSSKNLTSVIIKDISCGVYNGNGTFNQESAPKIGDNVGCIIGWDYQSIPGSAFSLFQQVNKNTYIGGNIATLGLATSEVSLPNTDDMVTRPNASAGTAQCFGTGIGSCL